MMEKRIAMRSPNVQLSIDGQKRKQVMDVVDRLMLTDEQVRRVMETLEREMQMGLNRDVTQRKKTSLQMENTYVPELLNGKEHGDFLALDLGGTNFRVLLCHMENGVCRSLSRNYNVPTAKLKGPAIHVFDHLAESIYNFLKEEKLLDQHFPLGFTFSFPMIQEGLKKGILITWTKSFACPDGVGQDAGRLLEEAITRRGDIHVDVVAILNDTTGTLMAGSYLDKKCGIGIIMGTGCNAAYVEKVSNVDKWQGSVDDDAEVVIDIEWGAFGDNGSLDFMKTEFDREIDRHSNHIGSFTFEKLFAGHYLGDLVRLVLCRLTDDGVLFHGIGSDRLRSWNTFTAEYLSDIERDTDIDATNSWQVIRDLELDAVATEDDVIILRYLCSALSIRAAQLVGACSAVLLNHMNRLENVIAMDGSMYRYHPRLHQMITDWLIELAPTVQSRLILAEDGSGRGAAFVAAVAVRLALAERHLQS